MREYPTLVWHKLKYAPQLKNGFHALTSASLHQLFWHLHNVFDHNTRQVKLCLLQFIVILLYTLSGNWDSSSMDTFLVTSGVATVYPSGAPVFY